MYHELLLALSGTAGAIFKVKDNCDELEVCIANQVFGIYLSLFGRSSPNFRNDTYTIRKCVK